MSPTVRTNLVAHGTRLHARAALLVTLRTLLARRMRFCTLTGTAGVGKTRLVRELGWIEAHNPRWTGGVWFVSCAACATEESLYLRIAETLELPRLDAENPAEDLSRALSAAGRVLLLLDNLEAMAPVAGALAAQWLARSEQLFLCATSRIRLGHDAEHVFDIAPLPIAEGALPLLLSRVRTARGTTSVLPSAELEAAERIATQLEGLPLALELAAARASVFGLTQLEQRLKNDVRVLDAGLNSGRTLRAALEESWQTLAPPAQDALLACAVFRGDFSPDAAEYVLSFDPAPLEQLEALRSRSLLYARAATADEMRLHLYESVRSFALGKAEERPAVFRSAQQRLVAWLVREGSLRELPVGAEAQQEAARWLSLEQENILTAIEQTLDRIATAPEEEEALLSLSVLLAPLLPLRSPGSRYETLLARVCALSVRSTEGLARVYHARALLQRYAGALSAALLSLERALKLARKAEFLATSAAVHYELGKRTEALELFSSAVALAQEQNDARMEGKIRANVGAILLFQGRDPEGHELQAAIALARATGDARTEAIALGNLGLCAMETRSPSARGYVEQALALALRLGDRRSSGVLHTTLGWIALSFKDWETARSELQTSIEELLVAASPRDLGLAYCGRGVVEVLCFETNEKAVKQAEEALARGVSLLRHCAPSFMVARCAAWWSCASALAENLQGARSAWALARSVLGNDPLDGVLLAAEGWLGLLGVDAKKERTAALRVAREHLNAARARTLDLEEQLAVERLEQVLAGEDSASDALQIAKDGSWFCVPGEARVEFGKQRSMRGLLQALAEQRARAPGKGLSLEALASAGWPGEKLVSSAAYNRVHVAISTLRKRGLQAWLVRKDDGWMLAAERPFVWVP